MRKPILIAAMIAAFAVPAFADALTLKDVRAMSDDELYALAETLSSEDESRLYQQARKEFPEGALGLQATLDEFEKTRSELESCLVAIEVGEPSDLRALNVSEPGRYLSLLRVVAIPSEDVFDLTVEERHSKSKDAGRETNRILRDLRECKRAYRKKFGDD